MIHSDSGADASMGQTVELEGNTTYRLSGWIKTVDFNPNTGFGAQLSVHELGQGAIQPVVTDRNSDWVFVTKTFRTNEAGNYNILALFGGWGLSIGTAYWDDVSLIVE